MLYKNIIMYAFFSLPGCVQDNQNSVRIAAAVGSSFAILLVVATIVIVIVIIRKHRHGKYSILYYYIVHVQLSVCRIDHGSLYCR